MVNAVQDRVQAWKFLQQQTAKVSDPVLRNAMMAEFRRRALAEWGYCPGDGTLAKNSDVVLDEWEKEFVTDIRDADAYGIDTRTEKRAETQRATKNNMRLFVLHGGTLSEIPADIRTPDIEALYYECLREYGAELRKHADSLISTEPQSIGEILPVVIDEIGRRMDGGKEEGAICSL